MQLRHRQSNGQKQRAAASLRLKAVQYLSMSEPDLARLIFKVETDPLFERIKPYIRRGQPARGAFCPAGSVDGAGVPADIGWGAHAREIALIRRIGQKDFEKYFLYGDLAYSTEEIAAATGLNDLEVRQVKGFVFAVSVQERQGSPGLTAAARRYSCLAKTGIYKGDPQLLWLLPQYARGRYEVDRSGLERLQVSLTVEERRRLRRLLGVMEFVNMRQAAVRRLVELIVKVQRKFCMTGEEVFLLPFTASEAARRLAVYPSTVSRALCCRSLMLDDGRELPLQYFLPNRRAVAVRAVGLLLADHPGATDEFLRCALLSRFHIRISRRTVNECRRAGR